MSGKSSESGLLKLWQRIAGGITAITGFVAGLLGFIQLVQGNAGLATMLLLIVGIGLLWIACLYYVRFWKPEAKDQGPAKPSSFLPEQERRQYELKVEKFQRQQAQRQKRRKAIRRSALIGVIVIPLLSLMGVLTWQYVQNLPTNEVVILLVKFDGPDEQSDRVTKTIYENLQTKTEAYADVKIATLDQPITELNGSKVARAAGERQKAAIVIWGWYGKTAETVPISVNFEVLNPPESLPELGETARGQVQTFALAELDSFQLQTRLSSEMAYLVLFTLGMARGVAADWESAIRFFTDALDQVDASVTALDQSIVYFYRGNSQLSQNNYEQASADYDKAIQLDPDYTDVYNNRGFAYANQGKYEQAIADYDKAIQLDPDYTDAYINRGIAYANQGKYEQAIADYDKAIQLVPEYVIPYNNKGIAYDKLGKYELAIASYNQAIQIVPKYADAYYNLGITYLNQGKYELAIVSFNQAIQIDPKGKYSDVYNNRGIAYAKQGKYDSAIANFTQAIQIDSEHVDAYYNWGLAYLNQGKCDSAITNFTHAIQIDSEYIDAYYNRGLIYKEMGDWKAAIDDFEKVLQLTEDPELRQDVEHQLQEIGG